MLIFLVALVILRLAMDKLVPENMNFESGANWAGSSIFGFVGAFISVGILTLGAGMLQFKSDFFGYTGWARDRATAQPGEVSSTPMFTAVYTARFYEMLSVGSLAPMMNGGALKQLYPEIDKMSWSMLRDGFVGDSGNGRSWLQPKSISITRQPVHLPPEFRLRIDQSRLPPVHRCLHRSREGERVILRQRQPVHAVKRSGPPRRACRHQHSAAADRVPQALRPAFEVRHADPVRLR